ncbi:MAG: winged helix-turn-helix domain-containing protein [Burkholderiales bacterium]|nr:winged helix-turn-helix domain-containing protein [Burkholderiales bacterium]
MSQVAQRKILLVEDDEVTALLLSSYLEGRGLTVEHEIRGDAAVKRIISTQPDAVVLDCNLPGKDGFEVCREVRTRYLSPIIMVTGRINEVDHVLGLELGADDYLPKPAQPAVVFAHLMALLRRSNAAEPDSSETDAGPEYRFGQFRIDRSTRSVYLGDDEIQFTTAEFDLLWQLASHAGEVLSRDTIMMHMRGLEYGGFDRSIDMRISRLRKRLGDDTNNPHRIKTVRAKGYLFSPSAWN